MTTLSGYGYYVMMGVEVWRRRGSGEDDALGMCRVRR